MSDLSDLTASRKAAWQPLFEHQAGCASCIEELASPGGAALCEIGLRLLKQARRDDDVARGRKRTWPVGLGTGPVDAPVGVQMSLSGRTHQGGAFPDRLAVDRIVLSVPSGSWSVDSFAIGGRAVRISSHPDPLLPTNTRFRPIPSDEPAVVEAGQETVLKAHKIREGAPPLAACWFGTEVD